MNNENIIIHPELSLDQLIYQAAQDAKQPIIELRNEQATTDSTQESLEALLEKKFKRCYIHLTSNTSFHSWHFSRNPLLVAF